MVGPDGSPRGREVRIGEAARLRRWISAGSLGLAVGAALAGSPAEATEPPDHPPVALVRLTYRSPLPLDIDRWPAQSRAACSGHMDYLLKAQASIRFVGEKPAAGNETAAEVIVFAPWSSAERFAAGDPLVLAGLATYEVELLDVLDLDEVRAWREQPQPDKWWPRELQPPKLPEQTPTPPQR